MCGTLVKSVDVHAQRAHRPALMGDAELPPRASGEVQRQQVLIAWVATHRKGSVLAVSVQGGLVIGRELFNHPVAKGFGPRRYVLWACLPVQFVMLPEPMSNMPSLRKAASARPT